MSGAHLSRVENALYLLEQATLVLLERRIGVHCLLNEKFYVPQLAEVEVTLALKPLHRFHQLSILLLQHTASGCSLTTASAGCRGSSTSRWSPCSSRRRRRPLAWWQRRGRACTKTFSPRERIVVAARVVLVPVSLGPLQKLQVVLHLAFDQLLNGDRVVDVVLAEGVAKDFEVLEIGIFGVHVELDAAHGHVKEDAVVDLAEGSAVGQRSVLLACEYG